MNDGQNSNFGDMTSNLLNSSDNGDIILVRDKKSKKPLIISIVAILLVVAVVSITLFIIFSNNNTKSFNEYIDEYQTLVKSLDENETIVSYEKYEELQNALTNIKTKIPDSLNEEDKEELKRLIDESSALISFYFISTILVDTNESYNYYLEHRNFDGFLSNYGYPINEQYEDGMLDNFKTAINLVLKEKETYYKEVTESDCIKLGEVTNKTYIDYPCLDNNTSVNEAELKKQNQEAILKDYSKGMLKLITNESDMISRIANGEDIIRGDEYENQ